MGIEIEDFKKRIASNTKDLDVAKNSYKSKRESSDVSNTYICTTKKFEVSELGENGITEQSYKDLKHNIPSNTVP